MLCITPCCASRCSRIAASSPSAAAEALCSCRSKRLLLALPSLRELAHRTQQPHVLRLHACCVADVHQLAERVTGGGRGGWRGRAAAQGVNLLQQQHNLAREVAHRRRSLRRLALRARRVRARRRGISLPLRRAALNLR